MAQKKATKAAAAKPAAPSKKAIGVAAGIGLTTAAVAAASAYFLYGSKNAAKNRKAVKSWALKAKAEVLEKLEDAQQMTREEYEQLVSSVSKAYSTAKSASKKDLAEFTKEMNEHWKAIERAAAPKKPAKKAAAKKAAPTKAAPAKAAPAKKAAKKATK